jgi:small-conductance mechanosensitive channel
MASNLNRIGHITLQEFPDDPNSSKPFVYYTHPAGEVVIAPYPSADGAVRWQFTPATLDNAQDLYDALQLVPIDYANVRNATGDSAFFVLRRLANGVSPRLTEEVAGIETWQGIALVVLLLMMPGASHLVGKPMEEAIAGAIGMKPYQVRIRYGIPIRLLVTGGLWLIASAVLGLPAHLSSPIHATGWILVILGVSWLVYRIIDRLTALIHSQTRKTKTTLDDVVVSLISGLLKVILVVATAVAVADVLGVPIETVLAGVGIGGLAFAIASKDLVANLFGSAIIAADRPFKRGDFVALGNIQGTVENVGLRSTRLRPLDDTAVTIPNNMFTTDTVVNLTRRRKIRLVETIHIDHAASVEALGRLRERVREELLADEMVAKENVRVGLDTLSLYAVEIQIACYIRTTNYDEFIFQKHRLMVHLLEVIEKTGVKRAVIRRD